MNYIIKYSSCMRPIFTLLIMYPVEYPKHQDFSGNHQLVAELD